MKYPKVLIVGQHFHKKSGGGITLTNLFSGWNKNNIAVVTFARKYPLDFSVCENNFLIAKEETEKGFPFNLKLNKKTVNHDTAAHTKRLERISSMDKVWLNKDDFVKDYLLNKTGQIHRRQRLVISNRLLNWIDGFSPDIIYSQLSSFELIKFVRDLQSKINKPLVIHIMDDWPASITKLQVGFFRLYWTRLIDKEFRYLLSKASVLMSISESMSEAYFSRYGKKFIPFHNPIEVEEWLPFTKTDWSLNNTFKVLYTGRIGTANNKSLISFSKVIDSINNPVIKIEFDVFTPDYQSEAAYSFKTYNGVNIKNSLPYHEMPTHLARYDLLFLPLDFDKDGINFARYSMPTKVAEYMISGTPILVFASMQTALAKYATKEEWAFVVSENNSKLLLNALKKIIYSKQLRRKISEKAKKVAICNENAIHVREKFRRCFEIE